MDIKFEFINVDEHFKTCVDFRRDSYFCSFDTYLGYEESIVGYEARMREHISDNRWYYIHIWSSGELIGQLEFRSYSELPSTGYVHLIYLVPKYRGLGIAALAHEFISNALGSAGCKQVLLSVSQTNIRAIKHYTRFGWSYLKPNPKHKVTDFYVRQLRS